MQNRGRFKSNTSGYKGVSFDNRMGMFRARVSINGKRIHLGYRDEAEDAYHDLYVPAAIKHHGEFARLK